MPVCGHILIVAAWSTIVGETQTMPVSEMHIEKTLVSTIKADTTLSECQETIVVAHIGGQDQKSTVEAIGPADIRHRCEC